MSPELSRYPCAYPLQRPIHRAASLGRNQQRRIQSLGYCHREFWVRWVLNLLAHNSSCFLYRIKVLPHIINAVILTSAWSAGSTYLWSSSRTLYSLSLQNQAPKFLSKLTKQGVPWVCVVICWVVGLLSFLSAGSGGASAAFQWLQNLTALAALNAWCKSADPPCFTIIDPLCRSARLCCRPNASSVHETGYPA